MESVTTEVSKYMTVREFAVKEGIHLSDGEIIIIQNMMRREADENDLVVETHEGVAAYHERYLHMFLDI